MSDHFVFIYIELVLIIVLLKKNVPVYLCSLCLKTLEINNIIIQIHIRSTTPLLCLKYCSFKN